MSRLINPFDMPSEYSHEMHISRYDRSINDLLYQKMERFMRLVIKSKILCIDDSQRVSKFMKNEYLISQSAYSPLEMFDFDNYWNGFLSDKEYNNNGRVDLDRIICSLHGKLKSLEMLSEISY